MARTPPIIPLIGPRVVLIPIAELHTDYVLRWRNDAQTRKWFNSGDHEITREQHINWLRSYQLKDDDYTFIICLPPNRPIGMVSLYRLCRDGLSAEFGRLLIGERDQLRSGFAREATALLLQFSKDELGLNEVYLHVKNTNAAAVALYVSLGFEPDTAVSEFPDNIRLKLTFR
jgi:RimJ/RimL family protein N-acetyltransferase